MAGTVEGYGLDEIAPGRGGDVDGRHARLLDPDRDDRRRWARAHVAEGDDGGLRLRPPHEIGAVRLERLRRLTADRLPDVDEVADPQLLEALLESDEGFVVVAEVELRVVIEEDRALL